MALPAVGCSKVQARAELKKGNSYYQQEQYSKALDYYRQALPIRREVGDRLGEATTLSNMGLAYHHLPAVSGQISDAQVEAFRTALGGAEKPALAFCRTGTRSTTLWALAASDRLSPQEILQTTSGAGYDLETLRPQLEAVSGKRSSETS